MNITIENDGVAEPLESFFVTLEKTPDIDGRITLDPVDGEIVIIDATGTYFSGICIISNPTANITLSRDYNGSGEDLPPGLRGCGCGGIVCYCV